MKLTRESLICAILDYNIHQDPLYTKTLFTKSKAVLLKIARAYGCLNPTHQFQSLKAKFVMQEVLRQKSIIRRHLV